MGQRISRAKAALTAAEARFELPTGAERAQRLDDVMAVICLIFNEGHTATAGSDWMRPELSYEAMRLARMLAELAPDDVEVLGLQALVEFQGSRLAARIDEHGDPVLLEAQEGVPCRGHQLAPDRGAVRRAGDGGFRPGGRGELRGRARARLRPRCRPGGPGDAGGGRAPALAARAERAR